MTWSKIIVEYALLVAGIPIFGELAPSLGSRFIRGGIMKVSVADSHLQIRGGPVSFLLIGPSGLSLV